MAHEPILVVDDTPSNRKLAQVILQAEGYEVRSAVDAEQALRLLQTFRPSLILTDIKLPGMDGFELTRRIKAQATTKDIPILALTGCALTGDEARARAAGCDGFMAKPFDIETLKKMIAGLLSARGERP